MKKYTIAEILHYAADKKLASKEEQCWNRGGTKEKFSRYAVEEAVGDLCNRLAYQELIAKVAEIDKDAADYMQGPMRKLKSFDACGNLWSVVYWGRYPTRSQLLV